MCGTWACCCRCCTVRSKCSCNAVSSSALDDALMQAAPWEEVDGDEEEEEEEVSVRVVLETVFPRRDQRHSGCSTWSRAASHHRSRYFMSMKTMNDSAHSDANWISRRKLPRKRGIHNSKHSRFSCVSHPDALHGRWPRMRRRTTSSASLTRVGTCLRASAVTRFVLQRRFRWTALSR